MTRSSRRHCAGLLLCAGVVGLGCTTRIADLTLVSTKNIDLSNATFDIRSGTRVTGSDCRIAPLGLQFSIPTLEGAVDDALEKGNGNVMVDQVTYLSNYFYFIVTQSCIRAEGTVLNTTPTS